MRSRIAQGEKNPSARREIRAARVRRAGFVDRAVADLARRRSVDPAEITVLEARGVVWPDGSLGCPKPGMEYTQGLQAGVLIRLQLGGRT